MNFYLIIHNVGFVISDLVAIGIVFFLVLNNPRAKGHIPLALSLLSVVAYITSHLIGVNNLDPYISRDIFMFNLSMFTIGMFLVHAVLADLGKDKEKRFILYFFYITGIAFILFFFEYPNLFLLSSVPKMYFPNYYEAGILNWTRLAYLYGLCAPYVFYELITSYIKSENVFQKKQLKYFSVALLFGFVVGFIPNFLVYNINIDPLMGMLFTPIFFAFFVYGAIKYGLMNIKVIAKQAFMYATIVGGISGFIFLFEYLSRFIENNYPNFPIWFMPGVSVLLIMFITLIVWKKIQEVDLLRYEFITTVTHKFRTPLTQIKWATDNLVNNTNLTPNDKDQISYIQAADTKLVELTNLLVNISEAENSVYDYKFEKINLKKIIDETVMSLETLIKNKKITINDIYPNDIFAKCDTSRIRFVIQTFIENALHYTQEGGSIDIVLRIEKEKILFSVRDSGIGIPQNELIFLFSKFYRGNKARTSDTEGMGIGLFISKEIIARHKGKIWASSDGSGKGSTFSFTLPV